MSTFDDKFKVIFQKASPNVAQSLFTKLQKAGIQGPITNALSTVYRQGAVPYSTLPTTRPDQIPKAPTPPPPTTMDRVGAYVSPQASGQVRATDIVRELPDAAIQTFSWPVKKLMNFASKSSAHALNILAAPVETLAAKIGKDPNLITTGDLLNDASGRWADRAEKIGNVFTDEGQGLGAFDEDAWNKLAKPLATDVLDKKKNILERTAALASLIDVGVMRVFADPLWLGAPKIPVPGRALTLGEKALAEQDALRALGLKQGATAEEINAAFRAKAKTTHPDILFRNTKPAEAELLKAQKEFSNIVAARNTLIAKFKGKVKPTVTQARSTAEQPAIRTTETPMVRTATPELPAKSAVIQSLQTKLQGKIAELQKVNPTSPAIKSLQATLDNLQTSTAVANRETAAKPTPRTFATSEPISQLTKPETLNELAKIKPLVTAEIYNKAKALIDQNIAPTYAVDKTHKITGVTASGKTIKGEIRATKAVSESPKIQAKTPITAKIQAPTKPQVVSKGTSMQPKRKIEDKNWELLYPYTDIPTAINNLEKIIANPETTDVWRNNAIKKIKKIKALMPIEKPITVRKQAELKREARLTKTQEEANNLKMVAEERAKNLAKPKSYREMLAQVEAKKAAVKKAEAKPKSIREYMAEREKAKALKAKEAQRGTSETLQTRVLFMPSEIANGLDKVWQKVIGDRAYNAFGWFVNKLSEIKVKLPSERTPGGTAVHYPFEYLFGTKLENLRPYNRQFQRGVAMAKADVLDIATDLAKLSRGEQSVVIKKIETMDYTNDKLGNIARDLESKFVQTGYDLVKRGLLKEETFKENLGKYFPRIYEAFDESNRIAAGILKKRLSNMGYVKLKKDAYGVIYRRGTQRIIKKFESKAARDAFVDETLKPNHKKFDTFAPLKQDKIEELKRIEKLPYVVVTRLLQEMKDVATYDFLSAVSKDKNLVSNIQNVDKGFVKQTPNTPAYGPLAGKYIHEWYRDNIRDMVELPTQSDRAFRLFNGIVKGMKTILDPAVGMANAVSNLFLADMQGVPLERADYWARNLYDALRNKGAYKTLAREGATKQTYAIEEIENFMKVGESDKEIRTLLDNDKKLSSFDVIGTMYSLVKKGWVKAGDLYSFSEDVAKAVCFDWATNELKMDKEQAIQFANDAIFNYSEVSRGLRTLRRTFAGAAFPTFAAKIIGQGIKTQIRKPFTIAKWHYIFGSLAAASLAYYGITSDDIKRLKPTYINSWFIVSGVERDARGNVTDIKLLDFSRYLPWGQMTNMPLGINSPRDLMFNPEFITKNQRGQIAPLEGQSVLSAFMPLQLLFKPVFELILNHSSFTDKEIYPEDATPLEKFFAWEDYLSTTWLPSWNPPLVPEGKGGALYQKLHDAFLQVPDFQGRAPAINEALLRIIGTKVTHIVPEDAFAFLLSDIKKDIKTYRSKLMSEESRYEAAVQNRNASAELKNQAKMRYDQKTKLIEAKLQDLSNEYEVTSEAQSQFEKNTKAQDKPQSRGSGLFGVKEAQAAAPDMPTRKTLEPGETEYNMVTGRTQYRQKTIIPGEPQLTTKWIDALYGAESSNGTNKKNEFNDAGKYGWQVGFTKGTYNGILNRAMKGDRRYMNLLESIDFSTPENARIAAIEYANFKNTVFDKNGKPIGKRFTNPVDIYVNVYNASGKGMAAARKNFLKYYK